MDRRRVPRLAYLLLLGLAVASCSSETIDVAAAQEQFCSDVEAYAESIGAYGGLFQDVELTVGDVKTASDELEPGLEAVRESGETFQAAVEADPESGVSIEIIEPETLAAVEAAEEAFAQASDIDDRTPVIEAGVEFSSAAYQLEVAWVRLFADAGCLEGDARRQADAKQWVSDYVSAIQTDLATIGYYQGDIDGVYGPQTIEAVEAFQEDNGLPVTGLVDPPTQAALQAALGDRESAQVGALQAILIATGHYSGSVDGIWSPAVQEALEALQGDLGVPVTGVVDAATLRALEAALAAAGEVPEFPSTTEQPPVATTAPDGATTTTVAEVTTTAAPPAPTTTEAPADSLLGVLAEAGQFTQFLAAVDAAGLTETLSGPGPFTIFAPTDAAFEAAGEIPSDPEALAALVMYHVVDGEVDAFTLQAASSLTTAQGGEIVVSVDQGLTILNGSTTVTVTNIRGGNGLAHAVNGVLAPPS